MASKRSLKEFLAEHPKLVSALLTLMLLWAQFGTAIATGGGESGP
jgi:hypothetical protein